MFSRVFSIDLRVSLRTRPMRRTASYSLRLRDVPALAYARAAVDRFELVAPDRAADDLADEARRARLPRDAPVVLELDHRVGGRVGDAALHRHAELVAELHALGLLSWLRAPCPSRRCRGGGWGRRGGRRSLRAERGSRARRISMSRVSVMGGSVRCAVTPRGNAVTRVDGTRSMRRRGADRGRVAHGRGRRRRAARRRQERREPATTPADADHDAASPRRRVCPRSTRCRSRCRPRPAQLDQVGEGRRRRACTERCTA